MMHLFTNIKSCFTLGEPFVYKMFPYNAQTAETIFRIQDIKKYMTLAFITGAIHSKYNILCTVYRLAQRRQHSIST